MKSILFVFFILVCACSTSRTSNNTSPGPEILYAHRWDLVELRGKQVSISEQTQPHLLFFEEDPPRVGGSVGCNHLSGTFQLTGESGLKFDPLITTKMACPDLEMESRFVNTLGEVDGWKVEEDKLSLMMGDKTGALLKATARETQK